MKGMSKLPQNRILTFGLLTSVIAVGWIPLAEADPDTAETRNDYWAWQPIAERPLPGVSDPDWCRNGIDNFILEKLDARDLAPAPEASREALIRRATFDLTGLPPTPEEVAK